MRHRTTPLSRRSGQHPSALAHGAAPRTTAPASALHFKIDRITVDGYSAADQKQFAHSLKSNLAELARRHSDHTWHEANGLTMDRLDAGQLPTGASPEDAARQIAARIFAKLTQKQIPGRSGGKGHA
jgi:hypothetical protein